MKCLDCEVVRAVVSDPRTPPLEEGTCLCHSCAINAIHEVMDECWTAISDFKDLQASYREAMNKGEIET